MKKLNKTSELMWFFGVIFIALGVAICNKASLGVSMIAAPAFIIYEAISSLWTSSSVGVVEYLFQGCLLVIMCLVIRKFNWRFLFAFLTAIIYGYTVDLFLLIMKDVTFNEIWLRWVMLIVGDIVTALGVASFFRTYMPLAVYELFVAQVSKRYKISMNKMKLFFDLSLLTVTLILAFSLFGDDSSFDWKTIYYTNFHSIVLGTIITTLINAPIIALWGKLLDALFNTTPLLPKFAEFINNDITKKYGNEVEYVRE